MRQWQWVLIAVMIVALLPTGTSAQLQDASLQTLAWDPYTNFQARLGSSTAGVYQGGSVIGAESVTGVFASIGVEFNMYEDYSVELALAYAQKGASGRTDPSLDTGFQPTQTIEGTTSLDYIELTAQWVALLNSSGSSQIRFYIGGGFAALVSASFSGTVDGVEQNDVDVKNKFQTADMIGIFGAGYAFNIKKVQVLLDVKAEFGFFNLAKDDLVGPIRTRAYYLTAGVGIPWLD